MPDSAAPFIAEGADGRQPQGGRAQANILVIDGNAFSRSCTLAGLGDAAEFVVEGAATVDLADETSPDIVLVQHHPGDAPEELSGRLRGARRAWPQAVVAVMSNAAPAIAVVALRSGAQIVLPSDAGLDIVVAAIRMTRFALAVLPVEVLSPLREAADAASLDQRRPNPEDPPALRGKQLEHLTPRQRDVIGVLAIGLSNKAIARRLGISESTVKVHIRAIMSATGVSNRTQLVARFLGPG